ncbi:hypothetical protein [Pseudomonas sp. B392_1p]|uniref:hypothetical protein n=1 Tax=Pseudomonas sp. B392_1p TaxID=3457507 RepID=UPI003FD11A6A
MSETTNKTTRDLQNKLKTIYETRKITQSFEYIYYLHRSTAHIWQELLKKAKIPAHTFI